MTRRDALLAVIDALHAEIAALKSFDIDALTRATSDKDEQVSRIADGWGNAPAEDDLRDLAEEAYRLNETSRTYVNLLAANVRQRIDRLTGTGPQSYRPTGLSVSVAA